MSMQFKSVRIMIPEGSGPKSVPGSVRFDAAVLESEFLIGGFRFNYRNRDHHIDEAEIEFLRVGSTNQDDRTVLFQMNCRYQDRNEDDSWDGYVDLVVLAKTGLAESPHIDTLKQ